MRTQLLAAALVTVLPLAAASIPGDARLGQEIFTTQKCNTCHSMDGKGGSAAPDLAKRTGRDYTPSQMASMMWNHAPAMWQAMDKAKLDRPNLTAEDAANLFAYFIAHRYFDRPGDAGRGLQILKSKGCTACHTVDGASGPGRAIKEWTAGSDPIELARQMWNHAPQMGEALTEKKKSWPVLDAQALTDIQVYVQSVTKNSTSGEFWPGPSDTGKVLFEAKACATCHQGKLALEGRMHGRSMNDLAAAMWNHAPKMLQMPPAIRPEEMKRLVGYLWSLQYFDTAGNAARGKAVFEKKQCMSCHGDASSGAPKLAGSGRQFDSMSMVASLWKHGPSMLQSMTQRKIGWPQFQRNDLADLIAYFNSK